MFSSVKKTLGRLVHKSTYIHHQPVNKISIVILIVIDIFVLINVFNGLTSIAEWPLAPAEELPCFAPHEQYQASNKKGNLEFNSAIIENIIEQNKLKFNSYPDVARRLGEVSSLCDEPTRLRKAINTNENVKLKINLDQNRSKILKLDQENQTLQSQYDSTLLEKIAGQSRQKSINTVTSDQIKSKIDANKSAISAIKQQIKDGQAKLTQSPTADVYLKFLNNKNSYLKIKNSYKSAEFWHPNKQLFLQTLFLLPLIVGAYFWHSLSTQKNRGLQALLSWHLLLIFCIPLILKIFEFIQFGNIIRIGLEWIVKLLGGLLFIASYGLILIIPLLGFGLIKTLQIFVFDLHVQAKNRIQKNHCISCNSKLRLGDEFCPYCGFEQYLECSNCHNKTYKLANFCKACGHKIGDMS